MALPVLECLIPIRALGNLVLVKVHYILLILTDLVAITD